MWKICRKIAFSECYQTPEIVLWTIFHCRTKHPDFIFLTEKQFPLKSFYTRNWLSVKPNATLDTILPLMELNLLKIYINMEKKKYSTKNIAKNLGTFLRPTALARSLKGSILEGSINVNPTNMAFSLKEWMNVNLSCIEKHLYKNTFLSLWLLSLFLFMLCFYASSSSDWRCRLRMWKAKHMIKLLLSIFIFGNKNTSSKHS